MATTWPCPTPGSSPGEQSTALTYLACRRVAGGSLVVGAEAEGRMGCRTGMHLCLAPSSYEAYVPRLTGKTTNAEKPSTGLVAPVFEGLMLQSPC